MSDVTQLSLYSLSRKAKQLKKKLSKTGEGKKQLEVSNDLAVSLGFKNWNALRKERLDYCKSLIIKMASPPFYQIQDSSKSIKVLNEMLRDDFINSLPDYLYGSVSRLKHILVALRDLSEDKKLGQESFDYSLSRDEIKPEHIITAFFYYEKIKGKNALIQRQERIRQFYESVYEECNKYEFLRIKELESDHVIIEPVNFSV